MTRFIFITGGVVSSLGKGIAAASLGALLQARGFNVRLRKLDPYFNVDPGTMNPIQHGEVFVTEDGAETDLDLGHYERFTDVDAMKSDNITAGQIYSKLIAKERNGDYLGRTVQVIPHVTGLIKEFIFNSIADVDFLLCEIGGTVGDIEGQPFLEAIRQVRHENLKDVLYLHVTLLPYISAVQEMKTKPTQHSVKELRSIGIQPDLLLCRAEREISDYNRKKISLMCSVQEQRVIAANDVRDIYEAPIAYHKHGLDEQVLKYFGVDAPEPDLTKWHKIVDDADKCNSEVKIALVGKYVKLYDAYKSVVESLNHAGGDNGVKVNIKWIDASDLSDDNVADYFKDIGGLLVPGGFGTEGMDGKIAAIKYARENKIPFFGLCIGMQLSLIEAARNLLNLGDSAGSSEFGDNFKHHIVYLMSEWMKDKHIKEVRNVSSAMGGTMRVGSYECRLKKDSLVRNIYGDSECIRERHRHRYECNPNYKERLESVGVIFSGISVNEGLPEVIEREDHPWFVGVQFHPELKSRPFKPHPLFVSFVQAAMKHK